MKKNYRRSILTFASSFVLLFSATITNAQCYICGTGSDGAYTASSNTTLAGGTYNYSTFTINSGVTVTVTGTTALTIYCTGNVVIDGTLDASGGSGTDGVTFGNAGIAGVGVAGGANGGDGIFSANTGPLDATSGSGLGAGVYGSGWSGGGGGGFSSLGQSSGGVGGAGGPIYGTAQFTIVYGGSGGGGGSGGFNCGSGGGGAGGGVIVISSCGTFTIGATGLIKCDGGNGGSDGNGNCGGGGGGSGGSIWLGSATITNNGSISAIKGIGGASAVPNTPFFGDGGDGSDGRIRLDYGTLNGIGSVSPTSGFNGGGMIIGTSSTPDSGPGNGTATATVSGGQSPYTYIWSPTGQTNATATGLTAGTYLIFVTDANGCTMNSSVVVGTSVGTFFTTSELTGMNVFPNPSSDLITISSNFYSMTQFNLSLLDINGKVLRSEEVNANGKWMHEMNVSELSNGIYMIRISNEDGSTVRKISILH